MSVRNKLKSSARSAVRPLWLVVWRRLEARIRAMELVPHRNDDAWQQHMPAFLNAVSTVGAFGHELLAYRKESLAGLAALERQFEPVIPQLADIRAQIEPLDRRLSDMRVQVEPLIPRIADIRAQIEPLDRRLSDMRVQVEPLIPRIAEIHAQIEPLDRRFSDMRAQVDALTPLRGQTDDLVRGQVTSEVRVSEIAARIEFVRREILFEMKYGGAGALSAAPPSSFEPRIVSTDKLAASWQSGPRLNLGCGHIPLDGYLNVDMRALPGVDIIAEAGNVPFQPGTVREVHSEHLLEHFPQEELRQRMLPYWLSLLKPGGTFSAVVPDGEAMLAHFAAGDYPFEQFREVLFGAQDYNGDFHFNMFMPQSLRALLDEAGFVNTEVPVKGRRNGLCYEFEINARRP